MWNNQIVTVVLPTYSEKDSIVQCIEAFQQLNEVDHVVVVNNNAEMGTKELVESTSAKQIFEKTQGYGAALKAGTKFAAEFSDIIVYCEPDGTFFPRDILKLLAYSQECEVVFGSRTVQTFIYGDANMGWFIRWGNWFVAKLIELLFGTTYMSDVGCTFRLFKREVAIEILKTELSDSSSYGLEQQLLIVASRKYKYVQIPVRYRKRVGNSTITGDPVKTIKLGLKMLKLVILKRLH